MRKLILHLIISTDGFISTKAGDVNRDIAAPIALVPERTVPFSEGMELRHYRPLYRS